MLQGLGNREKEYHIKMHEGVHPHALSTPKNVSQPICPKVKENVDRIERLGVIKK